jgi:hypothetical protein
MAAAHDRVAREDLVMFINACFACTGQREFYADAAGQRVAIDFLHDYILGNYRLLYARSVAAGINDFARATAIVRLLATGKSTPAEHREEEGQLLAAALDSLPTHRAYRALGALRSAGVNNRRSRAIVRDFLASRRDLPFEAVKYRGALRAVAAHSHVPMPPSEEIGGFLFRGPTDRIFKTPLFDAFRRSHFSEAAIYELPYTIAEGLAARRGVPRDVFLRRIEPRLTAAERLRLQTASKRDLGRHFALDLGTAPLGRLATYVLSLPLAERERRHAELTLALERAASRAAAKTGARYGHVAAVLDRSYSASGSSEKRRRPLAVALAASFFLRAASSRYSAHWTASTPDELLIDARGATDLATPVLDALESGPDMLVIVSDGYENDPLAGGGEVLRVWHKVRGRSAPFTVHLNPVFDSEGYAPRSLTHSIPTVGLRDAEDIPTMIAFARFACGDAVLAELEGYLLHRSRRFVEAMARRRSRGPHREAGESEAREDDAEGAEP